MPTEYITISIYIYINIVIRDGLTLPPTPPPQIVAPPCISRPRTAEQTAVSVTAIQHNT